GEDAADRALPAGMGGADHACYGIGEEDRRAVGGQYAQCDAGTSGDEGVGLGAVFGGEGRFDNVDGCAVDLSGERDREGAALEGHDGAMDILDDVGGVIADPARGVEGGEIAVRDAAAP